MRSPVARVRAHTSTVGHDAFQDLAIQISHALVIVNPVSRRGVSVLPVVEQALRGQRVQADVVFTKEAGDAARLARGRLARHDAIFVVGGDGTGAGGLGA